MLSALLQVLCAPGPNSENGESPYLDYAERSEAASCVLACSAEVHLPGHMTTSKTSKDIPPRTFLYTAILTIARRGPAKGYIEGLEHRLHDAETLLLQLLPLVNSDQLTSAAANATATQTRDSPDHTNARSSPPILNKKTGIDYWESFPLDTVSNIRRWQADCALHSHFKDDNSSNRGASSSRPGSTDVVGEHNHRRTSMSHHQYRSTIANDPTYQRHSSQDQYHNMSNSSTPVRYSGVPQQQQSAAYAMQAQTAYADPSAWHTNGMMTGTGQPMGMNQRQQRPPQMGMASNGSMEVDPTGSGFFSGEVKRHLFW